MTYFRKLDPKEAGDLVGADPYSALFPIPSFMTQFGLSWDELHAELLSGRMVAEGRKKGDGYDNIAISAGALADWMANAKTPPHLLNRVMSMMKGEESLSH